jgi:hypothetical protein
LRARLRESSHKSGPLAALPGAAMPAGRTVIEIEFVDAPTSRRWFWLVHCDGDVDVCLKDPGYATSVRVAAKVRALAEVWRGIRSMRDALRAGTVRLEGPANHRRAFPRWLLLSVYAPVRRER